MRHRLRAMSETSAHHQGEPQTLDFFAQGYFELLQRYEGKELPQDPRIAARLDEAREMRSKGVFDALQISA